MAFHKLVLFAVVFASFASSSLGAWSNFDRDFQFYYWCDGKWECQRNGDGSVRLSMQYNHLGGLTSRNKYRYGEFSVKMKFPTGYLGGSVPSFYLISDLYSDREDDGHDEIDFEFIGSYNAKASLIHTNLISHNDHWLEQFNFNFDPAKSYNTYTIQWGPKAVVWLINGLPIRTYLARPSKPFPRKPMHVVCSVWDASEWAPYKAKPEWGPVSVLYKDMDVRNTCKLGGKTSVPPCLRNPYSSMYAWNKKLTGRQVAFYRAFRRKYMAYSYLWKGKT